jgi:hypothetical protein
MNDALRKFSVALLLSLITGTLLSTQRARFSFGWEELSARNTLFTKVATVNDIVFAQADTAELFLCPASPEMNRCDQYAVLNDTSVQTQVSAASAFQHCPREQPAVSGFAQRMGGIRSCMATFNSEHSTQLQIAIAADNTGRVWRWMAPMGVAVFLVPIAHGFVAALVIAVLLSALSIRWNGQALCK